jgi:hypothetical protein
VRFLLSHSVCIRRRGCRHDDFSDLPQESPQSVMRAQTLVDRVATGRLALKALVQGYRVSLAGVEVFAVDDQLSIRIAPAVRATDAAPPAGRVEAWIAATLALSNHADCPARLLVAFADQHPGSDPSDPLHAERADQCAVLTALTDQWSRWCLTSAKSTR